MAAPHPTEVHPAHEHDGDAKYDDKEAAAGHDVQIVDGAAGYTEGEVDHAYLNASKQTKFYRGVFLQMIMFGALAFVGPAMSDAISNLGGGGLSTPYLANLATSLNYVGACVMTFAGGPILNKVGIKWSCLIAAIAMPLAGSGYYVQVRWKIDPFLLTARTIGGVCGGFLYVAEATAMMSYPLAGERGKYLGIWAAMRNSGAVIGGGINFSNNSQLSGAGAVKYSTYLIFIAFECTGVIWALLLSQTRKVRRPDGTPVPSSAAMTWGQEFAALWAHLKNRRTWLQFFPAFYSFFCGGVGGTFLALNFSVRSRALSSFLYPLLSIIIVMLYGKFILDNKRWSQKTRAYIAYGLWAVPQIICWCWMAVLYGNGGAGAIYKTQDYGGNAAEWAKYYMPYLIGMSSCYLCQISIYWILGTFTTDVRSSSRTGGLFRSFETAGQAVSYAINSNAGDKRIPLYVLIALWVACVPTMWALIRLVPEKPVDYDDVVDKKAAVGTEVVKGGAEPN